MSRSSRRCSGLLLCLLSAFASASSLSDVTSLDWRLALSEIPPMPSQDAVQVTGVPPSKRLAPILYGDDSERCREDADFLYDLSTENVTLASRCHRVYLGREVWQWAVDTIATFSSGVVPGKPSPLRPVLFHDESGCRRYAGPAERLAISEVALTADCRQAPQPDGKTLVILEVSVTLRP